MKVRIDSEPPILSGLPNQDIESVQKYLCYLRERINHMIALLDKEIQELEEGE